jgi:hypothetical protein
VRRITLCLGLAVAVGCHRAPARAPDGGADLALPPALDAACASSFAKASLNPVDLVFMFDRSGSMGDGVNGDPNLKWIPVVAGLKHFFADPASLGTSASLQYFPYLPLPDQCNSSNYYFADVTMRPLPDSTSFAASLDRTSPTGDTPTKPAMIGALDYAHDIQKAQPNDKVAVVLVTDGEPDQCESTVKNVSTEVEKAAASIPTYVIGVGESLTSLAMIAQAGGTGAPTLVSVGDPAATTQAFQKALEVIRGLTVSCDLPLPAPPDGMVLDKSKVNVVFSPSSGAPMPLYYSKDCADGSGWRYDNPASPSKVSLCPNICATAQSDRSGRIDVLFGCSTAGTIF